MCLHRLIIERDNAIAALGEIEGKAAKRSAEEELEGPTKKVGVHQLSFQN